MKGKENPYIIHTHNWNIPEPDPGVVYHYKMLADRYRGLLYLLQFKFEDSEVSVSELEQYGYSCELLEEIAKEYPLKVSFIPEKNKVICSRGIDRGHAPKILSYGAKLEEMEKIATEGIKKREGSISIPLSFDSDVALSLARLSSDNPEQVKPVELWVDVEKMIKDGKTILNCQGPNAYSANEDIGPEYIFNIKEAHAIENQYNDIPGIIAHLANSMWIQVVACIKHLKAKKKFDMEKTETRREGANWHTYKLEIHALEIDNEVRYEFILELSDNTSHIYRYRPFVWESEQLIQYFKTERTVIEEFCIKWFMEQALIADLVFAQNRSFPELLINWK